jgi:hypothetical protein
MNDIYGMEMSFKFLIQATRILQINNYDDKELKLIYEYSVSLDNEILNDYFNSCSIIGFKNDLELYIEIVEAMIHIFEEMEEYEKCFVLKKKKEESIKIINKNKI